jgi:anti-anti-sigma factor
MALSISREEPVSQRTEELLETDIKSVGIHALVALAGEVDISTVGHLYEQLAALQREGVQHVALNMAEVTFVDSTGLSVMVTLHKRMESMDGELIIFSPSAQLRRLFQIAGLDDYLNIRPRMD